MKWRPVLLLACFLPAARADAQSRLTQYYEAAQAQNDEYVCDEDEAKMLGKKVRTVNDAAFTILLRPIFSNVILGTNDLVQNTSAASFASDADKGTLNINYSILRGNNVGNIGVFGKSKDGIYINKSWNTEVGFKVGYSFAFGVSQFFDATPCEQLKNGRSYYMGKYLERIRDVEQVDIGALRAERQQLQQQTDVRFISETDLGLTVAVVQQNELRIKAIDQILAFHDSVAVSSDAIAKNVEHQLAMFDTASRVFTGYKLWWFSISGGLSNNSLSADSSKLSDAAKKNFLAKNMLKANVSAAFNFACNGKKRLWFAKFSNDLTLTNLLDHPSLKGKPILQHDSVTNIYSLLSTKKEVLGPYSDIEKKIFVWQPALYLSSFFMAQKSVGLDLRVEFRVPIEPVPAFYKNTFTVAMGPVFRLNTKESYSKGTVGVELGLFDALPGTWKNTWKNHFGAKFKIGVPFNAFTNPKK